MELFDDFQNYATGGLWTTTAGGSATITVGAGLGGLLTLATVDSTDNREVYLESTTALFSFVANKPFMAEISLQFTEANTNAANIAFGFMSAVGAASMQDDGAGPKADFTGAVIYKVDGGTVWKAASSLSTTQEISTSTTTAGGSDYQRLRIECKPVSSTLAEITYYVDGIQLKSTGGRPGTSKIKHNLTYTGALNMQLFACCKNGSVSAETLVIDYIAAEALRSRFV